MAGADLFWEKSTAGWLLVTDLFWEESTVGRWLISQANTPMFRGFVAAHGRKHVDNIYFVGFMIERLNPQCPPRFVTQLARLPSVITDKWEFWASSQNC
jgi:hypothetical protein